MDNGLIHLYHGDGKGKTTAAMGLAIRALGQGRSVAIVQFLKSGTSGELEPLRKLGAEIFSGKAGTRFFSQMTSEEQSETRRIHTLHLHQAVETHCDLLVLDEACAAASLQVVPEELLRQAVLQRPSGREIVLTGRNPSPWMLEAADYITEMRCVRHPYVRGITARKGIVY